MCDKLVTGIEELWKYEEIEIDVIDQVNHAGYIAPNVSKGRIELHVPCFHTLNYSIKQCVSGGEIIGIRLYYHSITKTEILDDLAVLHVKYSAALGSERSIVGYHDYRNAEVGVHRG